MKYIYSGGRIGEMNRIMNDILEVFEHIIKQYRTLDMCEKELHLLLNEDSALRADYKEWCETMGYTERKGFAEFFQEYVDREGSVWDSLEDQDL